MQEVIEKRTRSSKTHSLGGRKFSWDGTIGSIHYEDSGWQEIDNIFEPAVAPWDWEMLKAGYHIRVKEDFTAGQIIEFEVQGETNQFQPMALEWTNDLDQIQPISMPQNVSPIITNPVVDLLPGMPSHQGTIRWPDAYGQGIDFEWQCSSTRLVKTLEIENLNNLPVPEQYILDGGNPVLRLNLIFDPSKDVDIYVDGELWDRKVKKQTFNIIEFRKDGEILWGFMPLKYWGSGEDEEGQSVATLEKRGNKLYISIRVPYSWLQTAIFPVFIDTDVDKQTDVFSDDGQAAPGNVDYYSAAAADISVGALTYEQRDAHTWALFGGISGLSGVSIGVAYMSVKGHELDSGTPLTKIYADDQASPTYPGNMGDFLGRTRTDAGVEWNSPGLPKDDWANSPSIVSVIQELVDSYDPTAIQILHEDNGGSHASNNRVQYYQYDQSGNVSGPKLHIEYTVGEPPAEGQPYISRVQGVQGMRSWGGI